MHYIKCMSLIASIFEAYKNIIAFNSGHYRDQGYNHDLQFLNVMFTEYDEYKSPSELELDFVLLDQNLT